MIGYNPVHKKQIAERNLVKKEDKSGVLLEAGKSFDNEMIFILREYSEETGSVFSLCFSNKRQYQEKDGFYYIDYFDECQEAIVSQDTMRERFEQAYRVYKSIESGEYKNLYHYYFKFV